MMVLRLQFVVAACIGTAASAAMAQPARFWLSATCLPGAVNCVNPINPAVDLVDVEAPTINAAIGRERTLYIWAQPAPGTMLQNISLNLVVPDDLVSSIVPVVDFFPDPDPGPNPGSKIKVYNPTIGGQPRFQHVVDSTGSPPLGSNATAVQVRDENTADGIGGSAQGGGHDIQGFSFNCDDCVGIGNMSDSLSAMTSNGRAWLFASVSLQTVDDTGMNPYYLQMGYAGITKLQGQTASAAQVVFGDDAAVLNGPNQTVYASNVLDQRQFTFAADHYDVQVVAIPAQSGDFDGDGVIGAGDYGYWTSEFGQTVAAGTGADGNKDGVVNVADYVLWRKLAMPSPGGGNSFETLSPSVPECANLWAALAGMLTCLNCRRRTEERTESL